MIAFIHVTFILHVGFKNVYMNFRCLWLRITENKVVLETACNEIKEFKLKSVTDFNITPLY